MNWVKNIPLFSVLLLGLFFSVSVIILQTSYEQTPTDVEIILKPNGEGVYYNNWGIYGTASSKSIAASNVDDSGVTRVSNSKFQDFKFNTDAANLIPDGAQITRVVVEAQAKLASTSGSANNLELVLFSGTTNKGWNIGTSIPVVSSSDVTLAQREFVNNPLTGNAWQKSELVNNAAIISSKTVPFAFGLNQQTQQNSNKINVDTFVLKVYVKDTIPPTFNPVPGEPLLATGEALFGGTNINYSIPTATDNLDPSPIVSCVPSSGSLFAYSPNISGQTIHDILCTATDASGNSAQKTFQVIVQDTQAPVITVGGDSPKHWLYENEFNVGSDDEPVTVYDDAEGDINSSLIRTPTSLVKTVGVQTISYDADDESTLSSSAETKTRNINIIAINFSPKLIAGHQSSLIIEDQVASEEGDAIQVTLSSSKTNSFPVILKNQPGTFTFIATLQLTSTPPSSIPPVDGNCDEGYVLDEDTNQCVLDSSIYYFDVDTDGDLVTLNYRNLEKDFTSSEFGGNPASFGGTATNPLDPIRFYESDAYYVGSTATLRVRDANFVGDTIPLQLTSSNGNTFSLNATRVVGSAELFETTGVTIVNDNPDGAANVLISSAGTTLSATYNSFTAVANVISSPTVQQLFETDTTVVETCVSGDSDNGADTDFDGICDFWEHPSPNVALRIPTTTAGEYYELSCVDGATFATDPSGKTVCPSVGVPDLYVELDYMIGHTPSPVAINDVVNSFKNGFVRNSQGGVVGVNAHVFVDNEIQHIDLLPFADTQNPSTTTFLTLKQSNFGSDDEKNPNSCNIADQSCIDFVERVLTAKRQVFRYGMYIHDQQSNPGSSGYAERPGNDFLVSLGQYTAYQGSVGQQSGTLMHELGHTLGLYHGGQDDINCKPNYPSVMNYLYQFSLDDGGLLANRPLDFSRALYTTINENNLIDNSRIIGSTTRTIVVGGVDSDGNALPTYTATAGTNTAGRVKGTATTIDWDRNPGIITSGLSQNVHYFSNISGCQDTTKYGQSVDGSFTGLRSQDDWGAITFNFRNTNGFASGIINIVGIDDTESDNSSGTPDSETSSVHRVNAGPDTFLNEGQIYEPNITIVDPHQETWSVTFDYGDGVVKTVDGFSVTTETTEIDHLYQDDGVYTVTVTVYNGYATKSDTTTVTINNVSPTFDSLGTVTGFENNPITHTGGFISFASVDNPITLTADYGDGTVLSIPLSISPDGTSAIFTLEHTYGEVDNPVITLTADDGDDSLVTAQIIPVIQPVYDDVVFTDPLSTNPYQVGRNIPVKFTVIEDGQLVGGLSPEIWIQFGNNEPFAAASGNNIATYDPSNNSYSFGLDTDGFPSDGTPVSIITRLPDYPVAGDSHNTVITMKDGSNN